MRGGCVFVQSVLLFSVGDERRIRVVTRPLQVVEVRVRVRVRVSPNPNPNPSPNPNPNPLQVVEHLPRLAQSIHLPTCLALQTKQATPPADL